MKNLIKISALLFFLIIGMATSVSAQNYDKAVGLRGTGWGTGLTGKMFLNESAAVEVGLNYRNWGGTYGYSRLHIFGLYEIHQDIEAVDRLQWYYGGGAYFVNYSGDFDYYYSSRNSTGFGISGVIGLEYTFADYPISLSTDWMPSFGFGGWGGSYGGGGAIRYIF